MNKLVQFSLFLFVTLAAMQIPGHSFQGTMDHGAMQHHQMGDASAITPPSQAMLMKQEEDKRFSEFNHRFAGVFVMFAGLLVLLGPELSKRAPAIRYLWAALFLIPGIYLFIYSDPEAWPTGNQTLQHVITANPQVLQHKIFALILLGLGTLEFFRVRKQLQAFWAIAAFPIMAAAGSVLLFFHPHPMPPGTVMDDATMSAMMHIEHQHWGFAAVGFGIALSKAAVDSRKEDNRIARYIFAILMVVLGMQLMLYTE